MKDPELEPEIILHRKLKPEVQELDPFLEPEVETFKAEVTYIVKRKRRREDVLLQQTLYAYFRPLPLAVARSGEDLVHDARPVLVLEVPRLVFTTQEPAEHKQGSRLG